LKIPISSPLAFWTEQDVLLYIYLKKLPIASIYGEVVIDYKAMGTIEGQTSLFPVDQWKVGRYEKERLLLRTTGVERSGCITCGFGMASEKESRWLKLKESHPTFYNAMFNGGRYEYEIFDNKGTQIKIQRVDRDMLERWCEANKDNPRFLIRKTWKPHKGFGYKHIIDWINEHGGLRKKIQY
jgi:3'-phosphoadenosine 5'-phosphosulfate sulfotransferase (PAPS reductase)/FAD synthetase